MKDRHDAPDRNIHDLWRRGKLWEIFGLSSGNFTTLELAKQYSTLTKAYHDNPETRRTIDKAFAILNAPLTRQFYEGCRIVMQRIQNEVGRTAFRDSEHRIWLDLWNWVSERWQEPTEELIIAIKNKYRGHRLPDGTDAIELPQTSSDGSPRPTDLDSIMAAEAFAKETKCQGCGRFDHTLRVVTFPYVISIVVASFRRAGGGGAFCHRCRRAKSIKWALLSLFFGWWSIWGFFWNISALVDNYRGGKILPEYNDPLVLRLAWAHMVLGKISEAKAALAELLKHSSNKEALQLEKELDARYPEVSPAKTAKLRLGYLTLTFAILGVYSVIGMAVFGGVPPLKTYTLTTNVSPWGAGSVSVSGGKYESGAQVVVIATPASGYAFDHWSGSATGTTSDVMITMDSDKSVTANFQTIPIAPVVLFSDDFSDASSGWSEDTYEDYELRYEDGEYHVLVNHTYLAVDAWTLAGGRFTDFALEVDARAVSESSGCKYGIIFRLEDGDNFYDFEVTGDGYYGLYKYLNDEWVTLQAWTASDSVNEGHGINHLKVVCEGSQIQAYVNGSHLATIIDNSFVGGYVGVVVESSGTDVEVVFDNILVSQP